ncbi:MAG: hypothetical protein B7X08_05665 [Acidocella sp. 20-63-7]|nr:MAG: hypothetical protein B7X08_05665 [Acidocella sp. 20-63-7]
MDFLVHAIGFADKNFLRGRYVDTPRAVFEERLKEAESRFSGQDVPRPDFWSGWRLAPDYFEFWQAVDFRLHDRQTFTRSGAAWESGALFP